MTPTKRKRSDDHIIMVPGGAGCRNCGEHQPIPFPIAIPIMAAMMEAFTKMHRGCKPGPGGEARFRYTTPAEWSASWDTGLSSLVVYGVLSKPQGYGSIKVDTRAVPRDGADFGRCLRLVRVGIGWRERLGEVAARFPEWGPFVREWDALAALYDEEHPTGKAPKLYAAVRALEAEAQRIHRT